MTGKEPHKDIDRLARLYREQGDVEPGPGIDQHIRARARAGTRLSGMPRPAHWLGGAAVTASLFVVVSIVTNIQPPAAELPLIEATRSNGAPSSFEADTAESPTSGDRSSSPTQVSVEPAPAQLRDRSTPLRLAPASGNDLERRARSSASEDAARTAREQHQALGESRRAADDRAELEQAVEPANESGLDLMDENLDESERALWLIERLISVGNAQRARAEIDEFREHYPDREIPPNLMAKLEKLESSADPD